MEKNSIVVKHKTRCMDTEKALKGEENPCKEYTTTFDFSKCSEEEILLLALDDESGKVSQYLHRTSFL